MATNFNGTTASCSVDNAPSVDLSGVSPAQITVSFWMNAVIDASHNAPVVVLGHDVGIGSPKAFDIIPDGGNNRIIMSGYDATGGANAGQRSIPATTAAWHHFAVLFDYTQSGAAVISAVYVDGISQSMLDVLAAFTPTTFAAGNVFIVGAEQGPTLFFAGSMWQPAIYSGLLSGANITLLANQTNPLSVAGGPLYYWTLENGAAANETNLGSGNASVLIYKNTTNVADPPAPSPPATATLMGAQVM